MEDIKQKYPSASVFYDTYSPQNCMKWAVMSKKRCLFGTAPKLKDVMLSYGIDKAVAWLNLHLLELLQITNNGNADKLEVRVLSMISYSWISQYPNLKVSELWVYFLEYISGKEGKKLYGSLDLTEIGSEIRIKLKLREKEEENMYKKDLQKEEEELKRKWHKIKEESKIKCQKGYYEKLNEKEKMAVCCYVYNCKLETTNESEEFKRDLEEYRRSMKY